MLAASPSYVLHPFLVSRSFIPLHASPLHCLLSQWDADKSGTISRKEFAKAMGILGLENLSVAEALFDDLDKDRSGEIVRSQLGVEPMPPLHKPAPHSPPDRHRLLTPRGGRITSDDLG